MALGQISVLKAETEFILEKAKSAHESLEMGMLADSLEYMSEIIVSLLKKRRSPEEFRDEIMAMADELE